MEWLKSKRGAPSDSIHIRLGKGRVTFSQKFMEVSKLQKAKRVDVGFEDPVIAFRFGDKGEYTISRAKGIQGGALNASWLLDKNLPKWIKRGTYEPLFDDDPEVNAYVIEMESDEPAVASGQASQEDTPEEEPPDPDWETAKPEK